MSREKYFEVQNVSAGYGEKEIIHKVCFEVEPHTLTALVGPNGSHDEHLVHTWPS